jgi:hypothetical protein
MRLLLIGLVLLTPAWLVPAPPSKDHTEQTPASDTAKRREAKEIEPTPHSVVQQTFVNCAPCKEDRKPDTQSAPTNAYQWGEPLTAVSTAIIAAFTLVTVIAICFQIQTTRNSERAWMVAEMEPLPDDPPERTWRMVCHIRTLGKTPARMRAKGQRKVIEDKSHILPEVPPPYDKIERWDDGAILAPDGGILTFFYLFADETTSVYVGDRVLWIHGFVEYEDTFGRPHETRYCFRYYPRLGGKDLATVGFYPDGPRSYNKAT